ncbi:MAG TPA: hypothetical protein VNO31_53770 [Umezawaea sp.]|nr:hypothetical protein [Umezawaea sp.]
MTSRWSVGIEAEGDRVLTHDEILDLADAVAPSGGIASGIGTTRYGARLLVVADTREEAVERATAEFTAAARTANLPDYPISRVEAVSEEDDWREEARSRSPR